MKQTTFFVFILFFLVPGCASAPSASKQDDSKAKNFSVLPEKSLIYVYRPVRFAGSVRNWSIAVDNKYIGHIDVGAFYVIALDPGIHEISGAKASAYPVIIDTKPNHIYFVTMEPGKNDLGFSALIFISVENETGKKEIEKRKLTRYIKIHSKKLSPDVKEPPKSSQPAVLQPAISMGTCWPIQSGYVVTNFHVVKDSDDITLVLRHGEKIPATIYIRDAYNDIAILKPKYIDRIPPALPLSDENAEIGASVFTIGYPHPDVMGAKAKYSSGEINSLSGIKDDPRTYQISVPLQSGNSGGPLLNEKGEVVGIVMSKLNAAKMSRYTGDLATNVNYAIKIGYLSILLKGLEDTTGKINTLAPKQTTKEELIKRIELSVMMVIAK